MHDVDNDIDKSDISLGDAKQSKEVDELILLNL